MPVAKPTNKVLAGGTPFIEELQAEGVNVKPRLLVVKGTGDHQVVPAGANARNVLGIADIDPRKKIDDAFADGDPVKVISGPVAVVGILAESQTINKGDKLRAAANGQVQALQADQPVNEGGTSTYTIYYDRTVAIALETISTGVGETKPILMRLVV
jgi:hypothetical protein